MTATIVAIENADDERIAVFRDIRERDLRRRDGLFVAEGTVVLEALARSVTFEAVSILILDARLPGITPILERFTPDVPAYVVSRDTIDLVAGFPMHRGVLALARRSREYGANELLRGRPKRVLLLCNLANHDNVGACFRNASAFGVEAVIADAGTADPLYRKAIRVSTGAVLHVPHVAGGTITDHILAVQNAGYRVVALSPMATATIDQIDRHDPVALLVGTEGEGLPKALMETLDTAAIRMADGHDSVNVATSVAIALYELSKPPN